MRSKGVSHWVFAAAIAATLPYLNGGYWIAVVLVSAVLVVAGMVLRFGERLSGTGCQWLLETAASIDVRDTAIGFGLCMAGVSLMTNMFLPLGVTLLLVGALILGKGIGKNLTRLNPNKCLT